jgi:hypothetical protein
MEAEKLSPAESDAFRLALRVRHPSMDPAELSRAFKIEPEHSYRAGSKRPSRSNLTAPSVHSESYWLGELAPTEQLLHLSFAGLQHVTQRQQTAARRNLTSNLTWALASTCGRILKTQADLLRRIRAEGGDVTLLVTICSNELASFSLVPEATRLFGELGVAIEFEIVYE